jgi:hypothetical protein
MENTEGRITLSRRPCGTAHIQPVAQAPISMDSLPVEVVDAILGLVALLACVPICVQEVGRTPSPLGPIETGPVTASALSRPEREARSGGPAARAQVGALARMPLGGWRLCCCSAIRRSRRPSGGASVVAVRGMSVGCGHLCRCCCSGPPRLIAVAPVRRLSVGRGDQSRREHE